MQTVDTYGWRHIDDNRKVTFGWTRGNPSCDCAA